jgi:hypothetical protein
MVLLQDKATSGKQGLGIKDLPMKIAGHRWKGNKKSLGDSDDENSTQSELSELEEDEDEEGSGSDAEIKEIQQIAVKDVPVDAKPRIKFKKLCKKILRQVQSLVFSLCDTLKLQVCSCDHDVYWLLLFPGSISIHETEGAEGSCRGTINYIFRLLL